MGVLPQFVSHSGKVLVVSDSPETVDALPLTTNHLDRNAAKSFTLYKCEVPLNGPTSLRLWPYHVRKNIPDGMFVVIALSVASGSAAISSYVHEEYSSATYADDALCLSKVQLYQTFGSVQPAPTIGVSETILWALNAADLHLAQGLLQFTVAPVAPTTLRVRILGSHTSTISGSWADLPVDDWEDRHVRNWHPYSSLVLDGGTFDAYGSSNEVLRVGVCRGDGPEHGAQGFLKQPGNADPYGTPANLGCYGANLEYDFVLANSGSQAFPVFAYVEAVGNLYSWRGAIQVSEPGGYSARAVPPKGIQAGSDSCFARLTSNNDDTERPVLVQPGTETPLRIILSNAGTSGLPINLVLSRISFQPLEGGG